MCTGRCSRFVAGALYPLAAISIICNIILFFPDWQTKYANDGNLTPEVKYMGGVVGGGLMVIVPALFIHVTGQRGCCGNRCGMLLSILFAAVGVCGAAYSFEVARSGLVNGPFCNTEKGWETPFKSRGYLNNHEQSNICTDPTGVVEFNFALFSTLIFCSILQFILCGFQMINGLIGCICGTCIKKGPLFGALHPVS